MREHGIEVLKAERDFAVAILEGAGALVAVFDRSGRIVRFNRLCEEVTGYSLGEASGKLLWDFLLMPEEAESVKAVFAELNSGCTVRRHENHWVRKDGSRFLIDWSSAALLDPGGNVEYVISTGTVAEGKPSTEAIWERERYFRSLLFSMHEQILVIDKDLRIVDTNTSPMTRPSHNWKDEIIGRHCYEVSHGFDESCGNRGEECLVLEVFQSGLPRNARHEHRKEDGTRVWVDILYSPLKDETGKVTHVIEAVRDITHEMELQRQFRQAQKMEAIGTLAGGIAHDFNNILGVMLGYTEMTLLDLPGDSPLRENLTHVLKAGQRARDLVKQILTFSRQSEEDRESLSLAVIVKETMKMLRAVLPSTIEIRTEVKTAPGERGLILASPTQIHQILMNLCANAAHAMREGGGTLEVTVTNVDYGHDAVNCPRGLAAGSYVRLTIRDTGQGMSKATMERIFEPYFTTKGVGEGTGLGLAVVHGIVQSHGGVITVSSQIGVGTTFHMFFPKIERETKAEAVSIFDARPRGKERILFVDDEGALVEWGKRILERLGYDAFATSSSKEALDMFRTRPEAFDLVITDQTMPHMTGMDLARELMKIREDVPVILCTGFSELITQETAKKAGIRELIMKPLIMAGVATSIRRVLDGEGAGE